MLHSNFFKNLFIALVAVLLSYLIWGGLHDVIKMFLPENMNVDKYLSIMAWCESIWNVLFLAAILTRLEKVREGVFPYRTESN